MNAKTLKALNGSIQKWEKIVAGTGEDHGVQNCPLCNEFLLDGCSGCPIYDKTHVTSCDDTSFQLWVSHQAKEHDAPYGFGGLKVLCPTCRKLARAELRFLKSLLPKENK